MRQKVEAIAAWRAGRVEISKVLT